VFFLPRAACLDGDEAMAEMFANTLVPEDGARRNLRPQNRRRNSIATQKKSVDSMAGGGIFEKSVTTRAAAQPPFLDARSREMERAGVLASHAEIFILRFFFCAR